METLYRKCCELRNQEQQSLAKVEIVSPLPPQPRVEWMGVRKLADFYADSVVFTLSHVESGYGSPIAIYVPVLAYQAISNNPRPAVQLVPQDQGHLFFRACSGMWRSHPFRLQGDKKRFVLAGLSRPLATIPRLSRRRLRLPPVGF